MKKMLISVVVLSTLSLVGCGKTNEEQAMIDNYPKLEQQVKELETKLSEAQPWFDMKESEQKEVEKEVLAKKEEEQRRLTEGVSVYSDDRVNINYKGTTQNGVEFLVENKTDIKITIQADSIAVNGMSTDDIIMSDDVSPKSKGIVTVKTSISKLGVDLNSISTISGGLRVIDFNDSFDTYDVTFVNVDVSK